MLRPIALSCVFLLASCAQPEMKTMMPMAHATLQAAASQTVSGMVMLQQMDGHLMLHAKVAGLKPNAEFGFHVHDKGDCSKADFSSAGGHFNPQQQPHGSQTGMNHAGDLPNLRSDAEGKAELKMMFPELSLTAGKANHILGRALVIHANADDYQTQPAGNSGPRIACGVISAGMMK